MKKAVYLPTYNNHPSCIESWEIWGKKHQVSILHDSEKERPIWQRWSLFGDLVTQSSLNEYDKIALVNPCVMIHPSAPDFFSLTDDRLAVIYDPFLAGDIIKSLEKMQKAFPMTFVDWTEYFHTGLVIIGKRHELFCRKCFKFREENRELLDQLESDERLQEQTAINYLVKDQRIHTKGLHPAFNFSALEKRSALMDFKFTEKTFVWNFSDIPKPTANDWIEKTWRLDLLQNSC